MKIREIERLRAWAVLMTMLHHATYLNRPFARIGLSTFGGGVDLFFVISGFVVSLSLFKILPKLDAGENFFGRFKRSINALKIFYVRRIFRIVPMSWLWALVPLLLSILASKSRNPEFGAHLFGNWHGMVREALAVVTMRYNYLLHQLSPGILGVYWSLSVEEHFYLFLPLGLILFVSRHARVSFALFCMAAATLLIRPWIALASGGSGWLWVPYLTHTRFDALMAGVLIAVLMEAAQVQRNWFSNRKLRAVLVLAGLVGVWVFPNLYMDARFYGLGYTLTWISAGILVLLAGLNSGMVLEYRFLKTSLEYLGSRSYGIYLIHVPAGHIIEAIGHSQKMVATAYFDGLAGALLQGALTVGLAELCYRILERPCIAVGHAITSSWLLDHHNVKTAPGIKSPLAAVET